MVELDWFEDKCVELIGGEIIEMAPMLSPHWTALVLVQDELRKIFGEGFIVAGQLPLQMPNNSEPQPDVAVIRGGPRSYKDGLPTTAVLVVEISDTTLRYDRTTKASLYAAAGIEDYWILNLKARQLEVLRSPVEQARQKFGWAYLEKLEIKATGSIAPLAAPEVQIKVADLLP